jgi:hypothetical protein
MIDEVDFYDYDDDEPTRVTGHCEDCLWVENCPDACGGEGCDDFTEWRFE